MRGYIEGSDDPRTFHMEIEGGFQHPDGEGHPTVTVNPSIPMHVGAEGLEHPWGGPNLTYARLVGENAEALIEAARRVDGALSDSVKVVRALEYYIDGNSDSYWSYMERHFDWCVGTARHELAFHGTAHHVWQFWLTVLASGPWLAEDVGGSLESLLSAHASGLSNPIYRAFMAAKEANGDLLQVDRSLLDASRVLAQTSAAWRSGHIRLGMPESTVGLLDELVLLQDEFPRLRDVYQQVYESICRTLWLSICISNLAQNGDPEDFSGVHYYDSKGVRKGVGSFAAFKKLSNAFKLLTVRHSTPFGVLFERLDNRVRNMIGHASVRHDLRRGMIISDKDDPIYYFDFVSQVYALILPLSVAVVLARSARVLAAAVEASQSELTDQ